ncbi:CRISPR-associated RAMP protein, SSO1426 family [Megamonas hypermegale]|uniref:CRISPR-associated RAMP protein, SSO1426 family n=1 Tax=Megamonas hypermegale TaxID=158847 RepID=A0A378NUZ5_9FIRM|nr:RAMP superfamily CRISPR-associated protein [Megamonas hypermegale]STY72180.1 CRISPR-associated RAMP protein, SSO1426 family [Megamonas hypermegale]
MDRNDENSARIIKKIIFNIPMQTYSPLRISSGVDDGITDILVLKDKKGKAFIPGTSITGVLRAKMSNIYGDRAVDRLFGSIDDDGNQSMVNISDIVLENAKIINRDGIKIDSFTGVSKQGAKFDFEAIDKGATGDLYIEVTLRESCLSEQNKPNISYRKEHKDFAINGDVYGELTATIADILTEGINVGSLTTKGYGKIKSREPVKMYVFDFKNPQGAMKWWQYLNEGILQDVAYTGNKTVAVVSEKDFVMQMEFALTSSMIIRDYDVDTDDEKEKIAAVQMKSGEDFVIPATSIKGVLKSRAYRILMNLNHHDEQKAEDFLDKLMGRETDNKEDKGQKSRLYIDEVYIKPNILHSKKQSRNRIDRFTGGTIDSALFTDKPIWQTDKSKATIAINLQVQNCDEKEAGLMLLVMKDLWLGDLAIGGNKAIGKGVLKGKKCTIQYAGESFLIQDDGGFHVSDNIDKLEAYVQKLSGE